MPNGTGSGDLGAVFLADELMPDLVGAPFVDHLASRHDRLPLVALCEELDLQVDEIAGAPHLVGHRFHRPFDEARVVGVRGQIDVTPAHGEGELSINWIGHPQIGRSGRFGPDLIFVKSIPYLGR